MRIAALGRTRMLYDAVEALASAGHDIALVATCRAADEYDVREEHFAALARAHDADFLLTQSLNSEEALGRLAAAGAEMAVSVNWINLVGPRACAAFPRGIYNAHAGDLPRFRGNAPVAWAILLGEPHVGLCIHRMDPHALDAGEVALRARFPLAADTYVGDVQAWLDRRVPELFVELASGFERGRLEPTPQPTDPALALRCYPRRPEDARLIWSQPAEALGRLVRASAEPFTGAFATYEGERCTVWRARPAPWPCPSVAVPGQVVARDSDAGTVSVATGDGLLVLEAITLGEGTRARPADVLRSLRSRLT